MFERDSSFCFFSIALQASKRGYGWFGFGRSREDLMWSVNVLRARSFWAGFYVEIFGRLLWQDAPAWHGQCDRSLDSCLSWNPFIHGNVSLRQARPKTQTNFEEEERNPREEVLELWRLQKTPDAAGAWAELMLWVFITESWCWKSATDVQTTGIETFVYFPT